MYKMFKYKALPFYGRDAWIIMWSSAEWGAHTRKSIAETNYTCSHEQPMTGEYDIRWRKRQSQGQFNHIKHVHWIMSTPPNGTIRVQLQINNYPTVLHITVPTRIHTYMCIVPHPPDLSLRDTINTTREELMYSIILLWSIWDYAIKQFAINTASLTRTNTTPGGSTVT